MCVLHEKSINEYLHARLPEFDYIYIATTQAGILMLVHIFHEQNIGYYI